MEWLEANPLPPRCIECEAKGEEIDCDSCDYALERFYLSKKDELTLKKRGLQKAIERMERQIKEIDIELQELDFENYSSDQLKDLLRNP